MLQHSLVRLMVWKHQVVFGESPVILCDICDILECSVQ